MTAPDHPTDGPLPVVDPSPGVRLAWIVVGSLVLVASLFFGTVQAVGVLAHEERDQTASFDDPAIKVLDVRSDAGKVEVVGADVDLIRIDAHISDGMMATRYTTKVVGDRLEVRVHCHVLLSGPWCGARLRIVVPRDLEVQVRSGNGGISVRGLTGRVDASSQDGTVEAEGLAGTARLHSGNGSVRGTRLRSPSLEATSSNGSVRLEFAVAARSVIARSDNGSVEVAVPQGDAAYAVYAQSDNGSVANDVHTDSESERRIVATSNNGNVTVRYLD